MLCMSWQRKHSLNANARVPRKKMEVGPNHFYGEKIRLFSNTAVDNFCDIEKSMTINIILFFTFLAKLLFLFAIISIESDLSFVFHL